MIDFKEKLHKDANEILNESITFDEGIGSALASGAKMAGKGLVGGTKLAGKGIASGAKMAKNAYDTHKANKSIKSHEELVNKATTEAVKKVSNVLSQMEKGITQLEKVSKLEDAKKLMESMIKANEYITSRCKYCISVYNTALKAINSLKDQEDGKFF